MKPEDVQQSWNEQGEGAFTAVAQWRVAHPRATLAEIEQAVDEQITRLRARMIGEGVRASGGHLPTKWEEGVLHRLKHEGPERVLGHVTWLTSRFPQVQEQVSYLLKRRELMNYPTYQQQGWPIGSGSVESGHKLVMQARLKGPGMHWKPEHVNPLLALRLALLNGRWHENWAHQLRLRLRQQLLRRRSNQQQRFSQQQLRRQLSQPPPSAAPGPARQKTGRTEAQYRWGRQTFSLRKLQQAGDAKK